MRIYQRGTRRSGTKCAANQRLWQRWNQGKPRGKRKSSLLSPSRQSQQCVSHQATSDAADLEDAYRLVVLIFKCEDAEETVSTTCSTSAAALPNTWEQADCHWMCHFSYKRTCLNIHVAAAMWQQVKHIKLKIKKKNQRGKSVLWRRARRRGRSW